MIIRTSATGRFRSWAPAPKADVGHQAGKWSQSSSAKGGKRTQCIGHAKCKTTGKKELF